jgi:hypothetical protein
VKRTDRDEPVGVVIYTCMKTTQGISLCSYLNLKLAKMPCFCNYVLCFLLYKIGEQEGGTGSVFRGWHWWVCGGGRERGMRVNMVQNNVHTCM